jgi:acetyl esterase/lipase
MNTKHLVDEELLPALSLMPSFSMSAETLAPVRAMLSELVRQNRDAVPGPGIAAVERFIPGPKGAPGVRVLIYSAANSSGVKPGYLHMHGGGYVLGSPEMFAPQSGAIVGEAGCVVVSVDYRLAPETQHPGPVEDCYAALEWFYRNAASLGVDPRRIAIGGESAGGGLAAALGLLARDRGEVPVAFQLLSYPMIEDRSDAGNPHPFAGEFIWSAESNRFGWQSLLGPSAGGPGVSEYGAAARAENLAGLPPTCIGVGAIDLFLDENVAYALRLMRAGIPTELHVYPGAYHGFDLSVESADVSRRFKSDMVGALKRALSVRENCQVSTNPS